MRESPAAISLAALRRRAAAGAAAQPVTVDPGAWLTQGAVPAQLHEVYAVDRDDGPPAIGFAAGLAIAGARLPVLWVRTEEAERRAGRLHATGLIGLGLAPADLLLVVADDEAALLRIAADAARCIGIGTLLVESHGRGTGFDLTATRRLMLAAETSGVTVLCVRVGAAPVPSAAATRWGVAAVPSIALAANAPGRPAFAVECLRRRGGPAGACWLVEWNRETRSFEQRRTAALSGADLPLVAGGAAARHSPAPLRRAR